MDAPGGGTRMGASLKLKPLHPSATQGARVPPLPLSLPSASAMAHPPGMLESPEGGAETDSLKGS